MSTDTTERPAADSRRRDTRSAFDRFVEAAQGLVSRPATFAIAIAVIVVWALSYPLFHEIAEWHAVIHSIAAITSLLLLVLLENSGRRTEEAAQEKLNVMSEALIALLEEHAEAAPVDGERRAALTEQAERLRTAVGLEERH
jgi:low affinity Fe/Cu permease